MAGRWETDVEALRRSLQHFFQKRAHRDSEDLLQQTMVELVEAKERLRDERARFAYAFAIARRVLFAHFRQSERNLSVERDVDPADCSANGSTPFTDQESQTWFRLTLAGLPEGVRSVVYMSYWDGMSRAEIAASLGLPTGTVASRLRRGLGLLRRGLQKGT